MRYIKRNERTGAKQVYNTLTFDAPLTSPYITSGSLLNVDASNISSYSGTGNTWYDMSGNGINVLLSGSNGNFPTYSTLYGGVMSFSGVSACYAVNSSSLINPTSNPSVSQLVWAYPTKYGQIVTELGQQSIFGYGGTWHDSNIEIDTNGRFNFSIWYGELPMTSSFVRSPSYSFNSWYQLCLTYDYPSRICTGYVNGVSVGSTTFTRATTTASYYGLCVASSTTPSQQQGTGGGYIGSFAVFNRALSSLEVVQNYALTKRRFGL
jgi:hypothetical protein